MTIAPKLRLISAAAIPALSLAAATAQVQTTELFRSEPAFETVADVRLPEGSRQLAAQDGPEANVIYTGTDFASDPFLFTKARYGDQIVSFEYMVPPGSQAGVFVQGRYELKLGDSAGAATIDGSTAGAIAGGVNEQSNLPFAPIPPLANAAKPAGEWNAVRIKFRGVRYDVAHNKTDNACFLEVELNGQTVQRDMPVEQYTDGAFWDWEEVTGPFGILGSRGEIAIRSFDIARADFDAVKVPQPGQPSNLGELVDFVSVGSQTFHELGCIECHATVKDDPAFKTGPNLYGLFTRMPRKREIVESGENHRFLVEANRSYLERSLRYPAEDLSVAESGPNQGAPYLPVMPTFPAETLPDNKIDALYAYLATLNSHQNQGPVLVMVEKTGPKQYDPHQDTMQVLVSSRTRIQRGPMAGLSGRAIHVGQTNGINYSFDTRTLAIEKLWQGGFIDGSGEWRNRGGYAFAPGFENKEISLGEMGSLAAPLLPDGSRVDFSFKEARYRDFETIEESLNATADHLDRVAQVDADFEGYALDSSAPESVPVFRFRIGANHLRAQTEIAANGTLSMTLAGSAPTEQKFALNTDAIANISVTAGTVDGNGVWTIPASDKLNVTLSGKLQVASHVWRPQPSTFDHLSQPVQIEPTQAQLPAGYRSEQFLPPADNYGRTLLFEATGVAIAPDGTIVVGTRTAGIWRIVDGRWTLFAEGLYDCLGLVVEDEKGLVIVAGQKPELTRISDTDGDGIADTYDTLTDDFSFHGNYHSYMHGPVRDPEGNYYFNLNLLHADNAIYKAGGAFMGSSGGFRGWTIKLTPDGQFIPWANGLRSPAGVAFAPDGRLWYSENQGEFVATSKLFLLEEGKYYGHPSGLVDLPGMTPSSPEIAWDRFAAKTVKAVALFPHNIVANSPGNPAWDTTAGRFGPFAGQMFIGDQTQSKLMRVTTEIVDGVEQGCVIPFGKDLQSGIMRPVFTPDGSLLLGQTGRGWQSWGGKVASLQRIVWDGQSRPTCILNVHATADGFEISFTEPLDERVAAETLRSSLAVKSWTYRDAPDYGSPELDKVDETIASLTLGADRKTVSLTLAPVQYESIPGQTARVYHLSIPSEGLFLESDTAPLEAYYTRY